MDVLAAGQFICGPNTAPLITFGAGMLRFVPDPVSNTDCRMPMTAQVCRITLNKPDGFDPRKFLVPCMAEPERLCKDRPDAVGTAGRADSIMARRRVAFT